MKFFQETTDWLQHNVPNHTYIFGSSTMKIIGYIKQGETKAIKFSEPMAFDKRHRTFKILSAKQAKAFDLSAFTEETA